MKKKDKMVSCTITCSIIYFLMASVFTFEALMCEHLDYDFSFVGYGGTLLVRNTSIPWYEMMFTVGVVLSGLLLVLRAERYGIGKDKAVKVAILYTLSGYIGAKLLHVIETFSKEGVAELTRFGGVSLFGAVFGIPLCSFLIAKFLKLDRSEYKDMCIPSALLLLGCVRMGCFFKGCCHGVTFWVDMKPFIFPVQLVEGGLDFLFMSVLLVFERRKKYSGIRYDIFYIVYGIYRFLLEFLRDTPKIYCNFSEGQILSIICVILGLIRIIMIGLKKKSSDETVK